jgi:thymidylate synthase (FAD)
MRDVKILTGDPVVACIAEMNCVEDGLVDMLEWVRERRPECLPDALLDYQGRFCSSHTEHLWPHGLQRTDDGLLLTGNELLVELAARTCYYSFGRKAGHRSNAQYIANTQQGAVKHASILYHAKMSFFIAGISRRVSHELIRNYVGADRTEEGSPSQESTRYVEHAGMFVAPPAIVHDQDEMAMFTASMHSNYRNYLGYIRRRLEVHKAQYEADPTGMERKRIFESASHYLSHSAVTSFVWTTNPVALEKLFRERCAPEADAEFRRFALKWRAICLSRWPNLFPTLQAELGKETLP